MCLSVGRWVAVFTVAEFYMEYELSYVVPTCSGYDQLYELKALHVHELVCRSAVDKCPFHTTANCHQLAHNVHLTPGHITRSRVSASRLNRKAG